MFLLFILFFLALFLLPNHIPALRTEIENQLSQSLGDDFLIKWKRLDIELGGDLYVESVEIQDKLTKEILFSVEGLKVSFSYSDWLLKKSFPINSIWATGGIIHIPSMLSSNGLNQPLCDSIDLRIRKEGNTMITDAFQINHQQWHFTGRGTYNLSQNETLEPFELKSLYFSSIKKLESFLTKLPSVETDQFINFEWSPIHDAYQFVFAWNTPLFKLTEIELSELNLHLSVVVNKSEMSWNYAILDADRLKINTQEIEIDGIHFSSTKNQSVNIFPLLPVLPQSYEITAQSIHYRDYNCLDSSLLVSLLPGQINLSANTNFENSTIEAKTSLSLLGGIHLQPIRFKTLIYPNAIVDSIKDRLGSSAYSDIDFEKIELQGNLLINDKWKLHHIIFQSWFEKFRIAGIDYANGKIIGSFFGDELLLDRILATRESGEHVSGSYWQNLKTNDFVLLAEGKGYPDTVGAYVGSWWDRIFKSIKITQHPANADVRVEGNWNDPSSISGMTGAWTDSIIQYEGANAKDVEVIVAHFHDEVFLRYLSASDDKGRLTGSLIWDTKNMTSQGVPLHLNMDSTLGWETLTKIIPHSGLNQIESQSNPHVSATGTVISSHTNASHFKDFNFSLETADPLSVGNLTFENIHLRGRLDQQKLIVKNFDGNLFNGEAKGTLSLENFTDQKSLLQINLNLKNGDYGKLSQVFSPLSDSKKKKSQPITGMIDLELSMASPRDDWMAASGQGYFHIYDTQFGTIQFFGGLSRLFQSLGLNFTSIAVESAQGTWIMNPYHITIPKILLNGPNLNLDSQGEIFLPTYELNFAVNVFTVKSLFGLVMSPISGNLEFSLTGTLQNPNWGFRIAPFRWLKPIVE